MGRTPKKKMKKSELGAEEGNGMEIDESGIETVTGMEAWQEMGVPLPIIRALKDLGFTSPTEIQQQAIPVAMNTTRDVIGAAETVRYITSPVGRSNNYYYKEKGEGTAK